MLTKARDNSHYYFFGKILPAKLVFFPPLQGCRQLLNKIEEGGIKIWSFLNCFLAKREGQVEEDFDCTCLCTLALGEKNIFNQEQLCFFLVLLGRTSRRKERKGNTGQNATFCPWDPSSGFNFFEKQQRFYLLWLKCSPICKSQIFKTHAFHFFFSPNCWLRLVKHRKGLGETYSDSTSFSSFRHSRR